MWLPLARSAAPLRHIVSVLYRGVNRIRSPEHAKYAENGNSQGNGPKGAVAAREGPFAQVNKAA